jgi:hypothetical protein
MTAANPSLDPCHHRRTGEGGMRPASHCRQMGEGGGLPPSPSDGGGRRPANHCHRMGEGGGQPATVVRWGREEACRCHRRMEEGGGPSLPLLDGGAATIGWGREEARRHRRWMGEGGGPPSLLDPHCSSLDLCHRRHCRVEGGGLQLLSLNPPPLKVDPRCLASIQRRTGSG